MLEIKNISVSFASFSLEDITLTVNQGDYLTVLGVSGAGKTVLLEVLAGLVKPSRGQVWLNGKDITNQKIQERRMGLVYQDLSLFPHLTVAANIAYPLKQKGFKGQALKTKIQQLATDTGVMHLLERYPGTLSGGEAQRVALARTLGADPQVLLLDEPLSNLDVKLKTELRGLLRQINRSGKTIIHVTHDYMESATLSNTVAIIDQGRLVQTGMASEVFRHPKTEFVARFSGIRNLFPCQIEGDDPVAGLKKALVQDLGPVFFVGEGVMDQGFVMVPQEDIILSEHSLETSAQNQFQGVITEAFAAAGSMEIVVDAGVEFVVMVSRNSFHKMSLSPGKKIWLSFKASAARFLKD